MTQNILNLSFIGFGEAGQAFAKGLLTEDHAIKMRGFDIKMDGLEAAAKQENFDTYSVLSEASHAAACKGTDVIFSLVTAEQAESAAKSAAEQGLNGALYLDCNSCAPNTKRRSAQIIEAAGGRYVDVAVMTPVHPKLHKAPCLIAGPHAEAALQATQSIGMATTLAGDEVGAASTRKMIRSVMIKGLEALTLECMLAARQAGVEDDILASLEISFPGFEWDRRAPYMIERMATHGIRRAAEMREVVKTLDDLGVGSQMTQGTVTRQADVGAMGLHVSEADATNIPALTDTILAEMNVEKP